MPESRQLNGRTAMYTDVEEVTAQNVSDVIDDVSGTQSANSSDVSYLYAYYRGDQPILSREKTYNTEICNRVVENRAKEVTDFHVGYLLSAPIQYIDARTANSDEVLTAKKAQSSDIATLSRWMRSEAKEASDMEVAFWQSVCGTAYRMLSPKDQAPEDDGDAPFEIVDLDPRYTYVVYSSAPSHRPVLGVTYVEDSEGNRTTYAYTDAATFVVDSDGNVTSGTHQMGRVPIVEYPSGPARMGDFEPVVPLLDAINAAESDRVDGIDQFVQAIMVLRGVDVGDMSEFLTSVKEEGGLQIPNADGSVSYLSLDMNQTQQQTLVDGLYDAVLKVCAMPNPHSGFNTSDTGSAVILRDGYSATEAYASQTETWFRRSERSFLDMAIDFCDVAGGLSLSHQDVDIRFPRRNYTNDSANVSNLIAMLNSDRVHPELAFEHCDMFPDPHEAYLKSMAWYREATESATDAIMSEDDHGGSGDMRADAVADAGGDSLGEQTASPSAA